VYAKYVFFLAGLLKAAYKVPPPPPTRHLQRIENYSHSQAYSPL
jgi:hypothetical protein